jgi:hypothetical protein
MNYKERSSECLESKSTEEGNNCYEIKCCCHFDFGIMKDLKQVRIRDYFSRRVGWGRLRWIQNQNQNNNNNNIRKLEKKSSKTKMK